MSDLQIQRGRLLEELRACAADPKLQTTRARVLHVMERIREPDPALAEAMIYLIANTRDPEAHPALRQAGDQ